jgi:hypothetical protein
MKATLSKLLDKIAELLAHRKGLLPLLGIILVVFNWLLQIFIPTHWLSGTDFFLHLGVVISILGILLAWAL